MSPLLYAFVLFQNCNCLNAGLNWKHWLNNKIEPVTAKGPSWVGFALFVRRRQRLAPGGIQLSAPHIGTSNQRRVYDTNMAHRSLHKIPWHRPRCIGIRRQPYRKWWLRWWLLFRVQCHCLWRGTIHQSQKKSMNGWMHKVTMWWSYQGNRSVHYVPKVDYFVPSKVSRGQSRHVH